MPAHVCPETDVSPHVLEGTECPCDPTIEWIDPETELPHPNGPLVIHNCFEMPNEKKLGWAVVREDDE